MSSPPTTLQLLEIIFTLQGQVLQAAEQIAELNKCVGRIDVLEGYVAQDLMARKKSVKEGVRLLKKGWMSGGYGWDEHEDKKGDKKEDRSEDEDRNKDKRKKDRKEDKSEDKDEDGDKRKKTGKKNKNKKKRYAVDKNLNMDMYKDSDNDSSTDSNHGVRGDRGSGWASDEEETWMWQ
ncbi:hypothetical protein VTL71DRAFT_8879 [Oculimacula yallundae]|uniref:Uncharacterized protein n=1 Tax=Oculimacula yallundae TaxID=86028 RepID=A0ABR4BTY5_9HELO